MDTCKLRCAVLDDYQAAALALADWSPVLDRVAVTAFREHLEREEDVARAIADHAIVVMMRERTPFRASLFDRLPALRLLVTPAEARLMPSFAPVAREQPPRRAAELAEASRFC